MRNGRESTHQSPASTPSPHMSLVAQMRTPPIGVEALCPRRPDRSAPTRVPIARIGDVELPHTEEVLQIQAPKKHIGDQALCRRGVRHVTGGGKVHIDALGPAKSRS